MAVLVSIIGAALGSDALLLSIAAGKANAASRQVKEFS